MIAQICSGVNVPGVPHRGASASRAATDASAGPDRQRAAILNSLSVLFFRVVAPSVA
jgi:hypothetical protein